MICERFSYIIICSILSNLTINSSSATTSKVPEANLIENIAIVSLNQNSLSQKNQIAQNRLTDGQSEPQPDLSISRDSSNDESAPKINRFWFLLAMMVTSSISLFLLWNLFRKPAPSKEVVATLTKAEAQTNKQDLINDDKISEPVPQQQISYGQVSSGSNQAQENEPAIANSNNSSSSSVSMPVSMVENLAPNSNLIKINSGNDYIDVGLELIQDLRSQQLNTRRKAIWELATLGDSRCIAPLMAIMPQASAVDKSLIFKAVTQITNRSFKPINQQLFAALSDTNPQVRINAILDLTEFYQFVVPINQQLSQMQLDSDPEVKHRARQALAKLSQSNFPEPSPLVNGYSTPVNGSINSNVASGDKDKANQI